MGPNVARRRRRSFLTCVLAAGVAGLLCPTGALAQALQGRIVDEDTGTPVPLAVAVLLGPEGTPVTQALSGEDGLFRLEAPTPGFYILEVSGLGFGDFRSSVFPIGDGETVTLDVRVPADPLRLERLLVEVQGSRGRDRFQSRRDRGIGFFLDRAQLDALDPVDLIDIFRRVDDVQISWAFTRHDDGGSRPTPTVRAGPHSCMTYMLDDRPIRAGVGDNRSPLSLFPLSGLRMDDIQAVEVYRDLSEVPAEIRNSAFRPVWGENLAYHELTCGITVFRTKLRW